MEFNISNNGIVFGPYTNLDAGNYEIEINRLDNTENEINVILNSELSKNIIITQKIDFGSNKIEFKLDEDIETFQIVISNDFDESVIIGDIILTKESKILFFLRTIYYKTVGEFQILNKYNITTGTDFMISLL